MILEDIVESTKERVETNKKRHSIYELKEKAFAMPIDQSFPFKKALEKEGMSYILEVKRHSPSKGQIVSTFDFKAIAKEYEMIGADAISVVTEPDYFKGDDDFLREIKRIVKIPVLRKDFVVDEYMVYEAKILGADAILLIAGVLDEITLMRCVNLAHNLGMSAIVETHSSMQVKKALRVGAKIIGVNNRDLRDFSVDLNTTLKLRDMVDDDVIFISESGIKTREDIELLDMAGNEFSLEAVRAGKLSPVCFGSALTNFGIEPFLKHFLNMTTPPTPRMADGEVIDPYQENFSAFVFKIQANMNARHRDRMAFFRICSGKFEKGMEVYHYQGKKKIKLNQSKQLMADERSEVNEAYAGDVIGVFDPGIFSIGDTITTGKKHFAFEGIPTFAPEHFARVRPVDTMKRKQFVKGVEQIAKEGAIQIFTELGGGMEEIIVGVVGVLQFDVLKYRLENEYNVDIRLETLPYEHIRWIANKEEVKVDKIIGTSDMKKVTDLKGNPLLLFVNSWSVGMTEDRNPGLILTEFSK